MIRVRIISLAMLLLGLSVSSIALSANLASNSCVTFYSVSIETYAKKIQSQGDKLKKDSQWLAFPKGEPQIQRLVEELSSLSPSAQAELRGRIPKIKSKHREYNKIVLLALYDKQTWFDFLDRAMKGPLLDDSLVNSLIPIVRTMPEELRADVLAKVTPRYSSLSKVNFTKFPFRLNLRLAPKRSIDALILHIIKPDEWFKQDIEITQNPLESYTRYLQFLRTDIFANSDRGNYSTPEIMTVAEAIQKVLQQKASHLKNPSITITGSFPNGRAKIADTDLDSRLSHQELHALLDEMSNTVNQAMKVYPFPSHFTVEAMWATTTAHFAAQINPLFLRITPTEIQIEVYPAVRPLHKDSVLMNYNYESPALYTLKKTEAVNTKPTVSVLTPATHNASWVREQIQSELSDFSFNVKPSKKAKAAATPNELVDALLALSPPVKKDILFFVTNHQFIAANKEAKDLIKLALFYTPAWLEFLNKAMTHPQETDALFNALVPVFKAMPSTLKITLQHEIAKKYANISDRAWVRKGWLLKKVYGVLSPRDALDVITNQILPARETIEQQTKQGSSIESAYNQFLSTQYQLFYSSTKIKSYTFDYIRNVALKLQASVKAHPELFEKKPVYIVGRLPNGRVNTDDYGLELIVPDPLNKKAHSELSYAINGKTKPGTQGFVEVEFMSLETTTVKEAIVNPIQIKITDENIQLHIHSPVKNLDRDQYQLPQNYPVPAVYMLPPIEHTLTIVKEAS